MLCTFPGMYARLLFVFQLDE